MRTANNARFLGYLQGTPSADEIEAKREEWTKRWLADAEIKPVFLELLAKNGGHAAEPTHAVAAWEACVEPLKEKFTLVKLGFTKSDLYRVVLPDLVAKPEDFEFAWQTRKAELLKLWRTEKALAEFWDGDLGLNFDELKLEKLRKQTDISDTDFCELCQQLQTWVKGERRPWKLLGLRSAENYDEPEGAPRVATIYNGLCGRAQFVPFRKGDPDGNRWIDNEPLFVNWTRESVTWLSEAQEARWQGHKMFFTAGVTWSLHANHVAVKSRYQQPCVFDASGSRLTPLANLMAAQVFLAIVNSDVFSLFLKKFVKHNQDVEINDLRMMPLVMPTSGQEERLAELAERAIEAKRHIFAGETPSNPLVAFVRDLTAKLAASAPQYLQPSAQLKLLHTAADCLAVVELAVNWEAEKLYGVEGLGPFDEF